MAKKVTNKTKEITHKDRDRNKLNDLIFRRLKSGLRKDLIDLRDEYGLPKDGFIIIKGKNQKTTIEEAKAEQSRFDIENDKVLGPRLFEQIRKLLKKYRIPIHGHGMLMEYFYYGSLKKPLNDIDNFGGLDVDFYPINKGLKSLKDWNNSGIPFVTLILPAGVSLQHAQNDLENKWKFIENIWSAQGWKEPKETRIIKDKDMKERIVQLMSQPKENKNTKYSYRSTEVKKQLQKEFFGRKNLSEANINKINNENKIKKKDIKRGF